MTNRTSELIDTDSRHEEGDRVEEELMSKTPTFNTSRILTYYKKVAQRVPKCLEIISEDNEKSGTSSVTFMPKACEQA